MTYIHPLLGLLGVLVLGVHQHVLLVLLAVHPVVDSLQHTVMSRACQVSSVKYLTSDAVCPLTERTLEDVHIVVKDGPAGTVRGLAVESVLHVGLGLLH